MDRPALFPLIRHARQATDLRAVFLALGYEPANQPAEDGWQVVARWKRCPVEVTEAADPRAAVRARAARLAAAARPALLAALGPEEIAVAVPRIGTPGSSRVLSVPRAGPDPGALDLLRSLQPDPDATTLAHAIRLGERLASEEVGERFFEAFRAMLGRMTAGPGVRGRPDDRQLAALLTLTRVLFLYFVQAKGWLDGRPDYLRHRLDTTLAAGRHFHRSVLHPLFFGTLNRPADRRTTAPGLGAIPYLNGGLFEPHPVERRLGPVVFPNALWRDVFDGLFERFRFCVREAEDPGAVAPDMLGRVFERVMHPGERHRSGTFYTPEHLVRQIVEESVAAALEPRGVAPETFHALLRGDAPGPAARRAVHAELRKLRLLDPAVGSGAFLLGALEILTRAHTALQKNVNAATRVAIRRRVLRENVFGVDRSPIAVRLAELRLWLAVVAEDPADDVRDVAPLPNLDGVVRQGDSLLDPVGAARTLGLPLGVPPEPAAAVRRARDAVFESRGPDRAAAERRLRAAELALATAMVRHAESRVRAALRELTGIARARDLFGGRTGLTEPQERRRQALRRHRDALRATRRRLEEGTVPFFSFEVHRPEVMDAGGFDVVVGNPPWVRAERIEPPLRDVLKERFRWWRSGPSADGFGHLPDMAVAFLERAFELTVPGGAVGFLVPSKLVSAGYGAEARTALVRECELTCLYRVPDRDAAAFGATTYPLVVIARKQSPHAGHAVRLLPAPAEAATVPQRSLDVPGPWVLVPDRQRRAVDRFLAAGPPLATIAPPALGVKTGADRLLVGRLVTRDRTVARVRFGPDEVEIEQSFLRPALRGRDVGAFTMQSRRVVFWPYDRDGRLRVRLPRRAAAWIMQLTPRLTARSDYEEGPPWMLFRLRGALAPWRVVWADIARQPGAVVLECAGAGNAMPLNTCYVAPAPDRRTALAVCAVINSTWARAVVSVTADEARGGYHRHNATVIGRLPVPSSPEARARLARLARTCHDDSRFDRQRLDRTVAGALALDDDTRAALADLAAHSG